jgi:hypothetical protein
VARVDARRPTRRDLVGGAVAAWNEDRVIEGIQLALVGRGRHAGEMADASTTTSGRHRISPPPKGPTGDVTEVVQIRSTIGDVEESAMSSHHAGSCMRCVGRSPHRRPGS